METKENLLCGPFRPFLEERLANEIEEAKTVDPLAPVLVLVGSHVLARYLEKMLTDRLGSHANVRIFTLRDFCERLIGDTGLKPPAQGAIKTLIAREISRDSSAKDYFHAVSDRRGFASKLLETFDDLEQGCVERMPAGGKKWSPKVRRVFELYSEYVSRIQELFPTDVALIQSAAEKTPSIPSIFGTDRVIVYGFYDMTETQKRFVTSLAAQLYVMFMMPFEDSASFDYARPLRGWLLGLGFREEVAHVRETTETNLALIASGLSRSKMDQATVPRDDGTVGIISAPGEAREVREIAREILTIARERGIPFQDMAIILRSPKIYRRMLAEEFDRLDIPYYLSGGVPLSETREGRSLLRLCNLIGSDFSRRTVIDFLRSAPLDMGSLIGREEVHYAADLWNSVSRGANVIRGGGQWEERLREFAGRRGNQDDGRPDPPAQAALDLAGVVIKLFEGVDKLPSSGAIRAMASALIELYSTFVAQSPERDIVVEAVQELAGLGGENQRITREDFLEMIADHLSNSSIKRGRFASGGVNVLSIMEARGTSFPLVIIPGMVEKVFPSLVSEDPILLDRERSDLNDWMEGSVPLKRERAGEERMLFALGTSMARERLVLSYPRLDEATGRPRIPSYFLLEAAEAITAERVNYEQLERVPGFRRAPLLAGRGLNARDAVDESEFHLSFALSDDAGIAGAARTHLISDKRVERAINLIDSRFNTWRFGPFEGMLGWEAPLFPPEGRSYRATELEAYTRCPYRFFHERVLGVSLPEEPGDLIYIDPAVRGSLIHEILGDFFGRCRDEGLLPLHSGDRAWHEAIMSSVADKSFDRIEHEGACGLATPWEREKADIRVRLSDFLEEEYRTSGDYVPALFEVSFGREGDTLPEPVEIGVANPVPFRGRIDRIDVSSKGDCIRVIDYKTGGVRQKKGDPFIAKDAGRFPALCIQPMIYVSAAPRILGKSGCKNVTGELYYLFPGGGEPERVLFGGPDLADHAETLEKIVSSAAGAIARGIFVARPSSWCDNCDYNTACPADRNLLFQMKRNDARIADIEWMLNGELPPNE